MIPEVLAVAFIVALLRGGRFRTLADAQLKHLWLAFAALVLINLPWIIRLAASRIGGAHGAGSVQPALNVLSPVLHVLLFAVLVVFFFVNRGISGAHIVAAGLLINLLPIALNSGRMPVSLHMAQVAGQGTQLEYYLRRGMDRHCLMTGRTRLNWLSDWIPLPKPPFLQPSVGSPGDMVSTAGMFLLVQAVMGVGLRKLKEDEAVA